MARYDFVIGARVFFSHNLDGGEVRGQAGARQLVCLLGLVEGVFADDAGGEELALALHLKLIVLVDGEFLLLGRRL